MTYKVTSNVSLGTRNAYPLLVPDLAHVKTLASMALPSPLTASLNLRNLHRFIIPTTKASSVHFPVNLPTFHSVPKRSYKITSLAEEGIVEEIQKEEYDKGSHVPVMLSEVLRVFEGRQIRSFVDCTLGAGGHACSMIKAHSEMQRFVGLDVDPRAHEIAGPKLQAVIKENGGLVPRELKLDFICKNFREIKTALGETDSYLSENGVDGILMDLGMSSMQVDSAERGFSVLYDGPLDMRMNPQASLRAEDILSHWPEDEIGRILRDYGEEKRWQILQRKIGEARFAGGIHSTAELVEVIRQNFYGVAGRQGWLKTSIRVFQALRIAVNDELKTLESSLSEAFSCLASGGRLAVITFHSLEDRIVKQIFLDIINKDPTQESDSENADGLGGYIRKTEGKKRRRKRVSDICASEPWILRTVEGTCGRILTKKPIRPSSEEESSNRRCRSAKLRVIEKY